MPGAMGGFKLIKAARLIDGTGRPPVERGAALVEGDTIRAIGTWEDVRPPEGATVQEFTYDGKTILPGLIDCHVHLNGFGDGRRGDDLALLPDEVLVLQSARNARAHLYSGVTALRDCGAKHATTLMLRKAVEMGITPSPRLILCGKPLAIIGGHLSYFGAEVTGADQCRAAVRQAIKDGADFIKITATGGSTRTSFPGLPSFNLDEMKAICGEAHKFGRHTVAHCVAARGIINALDAGVDTIVHCSFMEPDGSRKFRPDVAERIAKQGVFVNPTLGQARVRIRALEGKASQGSLTAAEAAELEEMQRNTEASMENVRRMLSLGVTMVCGSDASWAWYPMGGFQHELEALAQAGMSPMQVIVSATFDSARSCWVADRLGTLEPGKQADVLVVDGDPSRDMEALWNVADVFLAGNRVDRDRFI
ncbi:MAG: amidohydrolase family protein [Chloroflexota bacterium]|nr:amidohydrolase family protein [Chloroflexota bacterium]